MTKYVYIIALIIVFTKCAKAQDTTSVKHPEGSGYVEKFDDWFVIKTSVVNTSEALVAKTGDFNITLQPNTSEVIRTYFNYQFISFYFDYAPRSAITNNDDLEKGRTSLFTIGGNINTRHWNADLNYSHTKGYYVTNTKDFRPDWQAGDAFIQIPDLHVKSYDIAIGYNTNANLSLPAASFQTERQLKSAGSFIPKVTFRYYIIDDRTPNISSNEKSNNIQALLGVGYQYTLVLKKSLYLVAALTPSIGYINTHVVQRSVTLNQFTDNGPIYLWDSKMGLGYNGYRFFTGTYLTVASAQFRQGQTTAHNQNASLFFEVFLGIRLKAPKLVSNTYNNLLNKL